MKLSHGHCGHVGGVDSFVRCHKRLVFSKTHVVEMDTCHFSDFRGIEANFTSCLSFDMLVVHISARSSRWTHSFPYIPYKNVNSFEINLLHMKIKNEVLPPKVR